MGARVYLASTGRFAQIDPIKGGTDNSYAYANDPVNDFDLSGEASWKSNFGKIAAIGAGGAIVALKAAKSTKPTWGYKLYSKGGELLKDGITSELKAEARYTKKFMGDKRMSNKIKFPNRRAAYNWETMQNKILRGPLNKNWHE